MVQAWRRAGPLTYDWSLSHFKGYRIGLFNYAKENTGGYVDFDYYDLSDVLTSDGKAVDTSACVRPLIRLTLCSLRNILWMSGIRCSRYSDKAKQALASDPSTQNEVDAPQRALSLQPAQLAADRQSGGWRKSWWWWIRPVTVTSRVTAIRPVMAASNSLLPLMIIHLNCHQLVRP